MIRKLFGIALISAGVMAAQERANVPLDDPSRPVQLRAHLMLGGITVRGADTKQVVVEARARSKEEEPDIEPPPEARGMKRIDGGGSGLDVTEENNVVTVKTSMMRPADLVITVPRHCSLQLKSMSGGDIYVEGVQGEIDADNMNGKVTLKDVSGSVLAHSMNGEVKVVLDQVDPSKPMSFSTMNGDIDVTLPDNFKANVRMKTDNGAIYSDFDVKLESGSHAERSEQGGMYHLRYDHGLRGTINGGGPDVQFTTYNGQIYIRKRK